MSRTAAINRITKARSALVLDQPWFGVLSLRLKVIKHAGLGTICTDGTSLEFDPAFIEPLTDAELTGVIAHEVMHCALRHMYRTGTRDMKQWNMACDYAINPLLSQTGFKLPAGALEDPQFNNMSAEAIYAKLGAQQQNQSGTKKENKPSPTGEFAIPQPSEDQDDTTDETKEGAKPEDKMNETDWEIAVEQATAIATKRGHISTDMQRMVALNRNSTSDWREILREFIQQVIPSDYSWQRPNRRYISAGLYLPGIVREGCPRLVCAIDTSGSINQELLNTFAAELDAVLHQCQPERIDVLYCDSTIQAEQSFTPEDELTAAQLTPKGGGGTAFQPVFDHVAKQDEPPVALIYLTDLDGDKPNEPDYPVLWVTPAWVNKPASFGRLVKLS